MSRVGGPAFASARMLGTESVPSLYAGAGNGDSGGPLLNEHGEIVGIASRAGLVNQNGQPIDQTGNAAIGHGQVLISLYSNVFDAGIAEFITKVLADPAPSPATAQDVKATVE